MSLDPIEDEVRPIVGSGAREADDGEGAGYSPGSSRVGGLIAY